MIDVYAIWRPVLFFYLIFIMESVRDLWYENTPNGVYYKVYIIDEYGRSLRKIVSTVSNVPAIWVLCALRQQFQWLPFHIQFRPFRSVNSSLRTSWFGFFYFSISFFPFLFSYSVSNRLRRFQWFQGCVHWFIRCTTDLVVGLSLRSNRTLTNCI